MGFNVVKQAWAQLVKQYVKWESIIDLKCSFATSVVCANCSQMGMFQNDPTPNPQKVTQHVIGMWVNMIINKTIHSMAIKVGLGRSLFAPYFFISFPLRKLRKAHRKDDDYQLELWRACGLLLRSKV